MHANEDPKYPPLVTMDDYPDHLPELLAKVIRWADRRGVVLIHFPEINEYGHILEGRWLAAITDSADCLFASENHMDEYFPLSADADTPQEALRELIDKLSPPSSPPTAERTPAPLQPEPHA